MRKIIIPILAFIISVIATCFWQKYGESWEILADGEKYLLIVESKIVSAPFGYRILIPYLVKILPLNPNTGFQLITTICLAATAVFIALYQLKMFDPSRLVAIACLFYFSSFAFIYYSTTLIRPDPFILMLIAFIIYRSNDNISSLMILLLITLGIFAHETILICIIFLWIDKIFQQKITGGMKYKYSQLLVISIGSIFVFIVSRKVLNVEVSSNMSYHKNLSDMFFYVIERNGGFTKHLMRIYASFGPIWLYALYFVSQYRSYKNYLTYYIICLFCIGLTFFATDTLRIMSLIYFPTIIYASRFIYNLMKSGQRNISISLILLQLLFSYIVYGHLRTFEASVAMNNIAILLSFITLILCIYVETRTRLKKSAVIN